MTRWKVGLHSGGSLLATLAVFELVPARLPARPVASPPIDAAALLPPLIPVEGPRRDSAGLFELTLKSSGIENLESQLTDAGATAQDAKRAVDLLRPQLGDDFATGADVKLSLGDEAIPGGRSIVALAVITDLGMQRVTRGPAGLDLAAQAAARRVSAKIDGGSYWSLRAAGLAPEVASEAARLADQRLGAGQGAEISAVIGERPARFGNATSARLLYLAVERLGQPARRIMAWPGAANNWIDPDRPVAATSAMARPVTGRVTSGYGARFHPILQFFRPHRGLDFAARFGEAVHAVADGCVTGSGWRGGYGRQVRLIHRGTIVSSYSHLSSAAVSEGQCVRRGDIIGQAGASGLATGPHLHFELHRAGQPVDPRHLMSAPSAIDGAQRDAIAARLARLERA